MNDAQLLRYSRHILLPQLDIDGQQTLLDSRVLIIGLGGLGSPVTLYLAASGVGHLTLVDDDKVALSNLQRQIIHNENNLTQPKVTSAAESVRGLNCDCQVEAINQRLDRDAMMTEVEKADVVVDCSDNFASRFLINEVTQALKVPLVSAAAIRMEGHMTVYDARQKGSPCYRCLYQAGEGELQESCSQSGVLSPLLGVIGSMQAIETIKVLTGMGETAVGKLLVFDAMNLSWQIIRLRQDPACPVCEKG